MVVENLLWLLSGSHPDPEEPVFLGQRFHRERFHYMTGGAGTKGKEGTFWEQNLGQII